MSPLAAVTLSLYLAAAASAVALARRDRRHRPVAAYLIAVVALDGLRWARALLLPPAHGLRVGWELWLRHVEVGLYLASILALPVLAACVLTRRPRCLYYVGAGLVLWALIVAGYPELRGAPLLRLYTVLEAGAVAVTAALWWPRRRERSPAVLCVEALGAGAAATVALSARWPDTVAANAVAVALVLLVQLQATAPRRARG